MQIYTTSLTMSMEGLMVVLLLLDLAFVAHGGPRFRRAVGGTIMPKGKSPWLVSLWFMPSNPFTFKTKLHHVCGAAIIAPRFVLTSAQCFEPSFMSGAENLRDWVVVGGKYSQLINATTNQWKRIRTVHWNPGWDPAHYAAGDVAILELQEPFDMEKSGVELISYEDTDGCVIPGQICSMAGWGQKVERPYGMGLILPREITVEVVETEKCVYFMTANRLSGLEYLIDDTILCAGGLDQGPCAGDLGSPLVCRCNGKPVIGGIVTTGPRCGQVRVFGLYTRVSHYIARIKQVVEAGKT